MFYKVGLLLVPDDVFTFENAEELTEEGLPFLILFHKPDDLESIRRYNEIVQTQLIGEKRMLFTHLIIYSGLIGIILQNLLIS